LPCLEARFLRYRNKYVYLPDYVDVIDVPVVPFVLSSYWSTYYFGRGLKSDGPVEKTILLRHAR
jgi:hypothetical protein